MTDKPITVVFDFAQPESYLALDPTLELAKDLGVEIDWRPGIAPKRSKPAPERADDDRTAKHMRLRAEYRERDLERYARARGLTLGNLYRNEDSSLAGALLLWLESRAPASVEAFLRSVFEGFWSGNLEIESIVALMQVVSSVAKELEPGRFEPTKSLRDYEEGLESQKEAGVLSTPTYLVGEELFLGRAHLPMIRWLLQGKEGPPPI